MPWKKILFWFGIIGAFASIISLIYIFAPIKKNAKLNVNISSVEKLTSFNKIDEPEFFVDYFYKGQEIENLWKINVKFKNNSRVTLIGEGVQKNIIPDTLTFFLNDSCEIIDKKEILSNFNHLLVIKDNKQILINFSQWRENEELNYMFYLKSNLDSIDINNIIKEDRIRQIIDGDIYLNYVETRTKFTDFIPLSLRKMFYLYTLIAIGILLFIIILILILSPIEYNKVLKWELNNLDLYNNYILKKFSQKPEFIEKYKSPSDLPEYLWKEIEAEPYPDNIFDFEFTNIRKMIGVEFILIVLFLSLGTVFFDLIFYFP
jgi:hypothetical protein